MTIRSIVDLSGPTDVQTTNERMEVRVSFAVYDITVPVMVHGLNVMDDYLDHAQALERTKAFEPGRILGERLAPDMLTFGEQFSVSCNKVEAHMAKLMQHDPPAPSNTPMMYPALKGRLHISIAHAILRHLGAKIGRRNYLGNLTQQSGGDYS